MNEIKLILDDKDFSDVNDAIEDRSSWGLMPNDDGSNAAGACIAEICRSWNEMLRMRQGRRPESGEGWKTGE